MHPRLRPLILACPVIALACHDPQGIAQGALEARGVEDIRLLAAGSKGDFTFVGKRGQDDCSGTVAVQPHDDATSAKLALECLPPAGAWTSSLPAGVDPATVAQARRCDGGIAPACTALGLLFHAGEGVPKDQARANMLFNQGCANQDAEGCYRMATSLLATGPGRDAEVDKLLVDACDLGSAVACGQAAQRLYNADVQDQVPTLARVARKGCDADEPQACLVLGVLLAYGLGMPLDMDQARRRLMQACGAKLESACELVESL